jgi:predicted CxxxxCH...CXXCH cytochrome family protein
VLVALTLTFISLAGLPGKAEAATCLTCHAPVGSTTDIRPVESTYRNITTGSIVGSHAKHIPAATLDANACASCHGTAASGYLTNHRNGFITVTSAGGIGYSKATSFPQSGSKTLTLGSCSAASCHANPYGAGSVTSPVWGTAAANCTACHTTPIGATGPATGSHTTTTAHAVVCTTCHAAGTTATSTPATGHNNGSIDIANVGYPLAKAKGSAAASCSNASCHLNVYGAGSVTTPVWGTSASCNACHAVTIDATGPNTGSHAKHNDSTCTDCHAAGTTAITKPTTGHADGNVTVTNGYPVTAKHAAGSYSGTCSTAACHDNGKGVVVLTPVWGATNVPACTACHALIPGDSHTKHISTTTYKKALCADCHTGYVQGSTAAANHVNGTVEVNIGSYPSPKAKGSAFGTCTTSYCHSSGQSADGLSATPVYATVKWGDTVVCGSCHATTTLNSGTHAKHIASDNNCDYCHSQAYSTGANSYVYNSASHVNGQIEVTSMGYTAGGAPGNGYGTCSTAICHGSIAPPAWGVNTANDTCTKCHGTGTVTVTAANKYVIAPSDATATDKGKVSLLPKVGAHQTHLQLLNGLSQQGASAEARCVTCHGTLPTAGSHVVGGMFSGVTANPTSTFNGLATTSTGGTMTPSYSAGSCSNTYCHNPAGTNGTLDPLNAGTGTSPSWTNAGYLGDTLKSDANCNACHKSPGNPAFTLASHNSTQMPQGIATDCSSCHGHNGGVGGAIGKQHMDGIRYASGACDACHGYPPMSAAKLAARSGADFAGARLEDYAGGGGYHSSHLLATVTVADGFTPCLPCHPSTVHMQGGSTITQANVNVNYDAADTNLRFDGTRSKRYNNTDVKWTCSNISCHFKPSPAWNL